MQHMFTSEDLSKGVWLSHPDRVYCRWHWNSVARQLVVEAGDVTRTWTTPDLDQSGEAGISIDLPETAKDIARLIERQSGRAALS